MKAALQKKIEKIEVIVCDVDGVLTDGKIIFDSSRSEIKRFDAYDGFALTLVKEMGFKTAFLSGRSSRVTAHRAYKLKIDKVYQNAHPKIKVFKRMLRDFHVRSDQVCFIGDDLIDLQVLKSVGFSVAVANAVKEVKKAVDYVTAKKGGQGAVRETVELILKTQGKWTKALKRYS